jgi:hypothetical protein
MSVWTTGLPRPTLDEIDAAFRATGFPQWRVIVEAVGATTAKGPRWPPTSCESRGEFCVSKMRKWTDVEWAE